uniref:Uncharacterized protein n=1 Tax=Panagrolaimus davidi TaxID=227884 RepID=A0A914R0C4_9BILA
MASEKSRKESVDFAKKQTFGGAQHPFDRLRGFKRVDRYLQTSDTGFTRLEITENDYRTLCRNSSRVVMTESDELPQNVRRIKIFLRKKVENNNDDKNMNRKPLPSSTTKENSAPPTFIAPLTPRPQKVRKTFNLEEDTTDE